MMMGVMTKPVELFNVKISSLKRDFTINTEVTKVHKRELLSLENPRYKQCLDKYEHLKGVEMDDLDNKNILPVNLILGASDYARIKTDTATHWSFERTCSREDQARVDNHFCGKRS